MIKQILIVFILIIFSAYGYYDLIQDNGFEGLDLFIEKKTVYEQNKPPQVYFSGSNNLTQTLIDLFNNSTEIKCAFYDLDEPNIIKTLKEKNAIVTIEDDNALNDFSTGKSSAKMHNKFCILDNNTVFTGSTNPTMRGLNKNDNNIIIIYSEYIAKNYLDEFEEIYNNQFGKGNKVKYKRVVLNNKTKITNLFCPEDNCQENVLNELDSANKSIYFMTFSFTDKKIADKLIEKKKQGIDVVGVMEKGRINMWYNVYKYINESVTVVPDKSGFNMHHKVFIVDNKTVITGSYNPTMSGNERNDENIIIINDKEIAKEYLEEFERLIN